MGLVHSHRGPLLGSEGAAVTADRTHTLIAAILVALLALIVGMGLAGCDSRSYLGAVADARATAQAAKLASDPLARAKLYEEVGRRVMALSDGIPDLPKPERDPALIVADPDGWCSTDAPSPPYEAPPPPAPSPWQQFRHLGDTMIRWGGILFACAGTLALVGWIAGKLGWAGIIWSIVGSPITSGLARLAASLGGGSALLGTGVVWATIYWWAIVLAVLLALVLVAITHRKDAMRIWSRVTGKGKP